MRNMSKMLKQIKKVQQEMEKAQKELENKEVTGSAGGGVVKVVLNGQKKLLSIEIDPDVVDPDDVEMLQDLITAAFNDALKQVDQLIERDLGRFTPGFNLPGLF